MNTTTVAIERRTHPMDPLSADEITAVRDHLIEAGRLGETVRVAYLSLKEPAKARLRVGDDVPREARVILLDTATGATTDLVVSLSEERITAETAVDPELVGQAPVLL